MGLDLQTVYKVFQEAGKIDLYGKVLDMNTKLIEMQEENQELKGRLKKLNDNSKIAQNLVLKENLYWLKKGDVEDGPFCTRCWDKDKGLIRVPVYDNQYSYACPECKTSILNKHWVAPQSVHDLY